MKFRFLILFGLVFASFAQAKQAPKFSGELMSGGRAKLEKLITPKRALLLCFWATWCAPCLQELKSVTAHLKEHPELPLDLMTVNVDTSESATDVKPLVKQNGYTFPVILDPKHEILAKYNESKELPFSVLIGDNSAIELTFKGYREDMFTQIEGVLAKSKGNK